MELELQQKLFDTYPNIFRDRHKSMTQTCMCWGICCDDGWYDLINNLCNDITSALKTEKWLVIADQVKEKFGGLKFYFHWEPTEDNAEALNDEIMDRIENLVNKAEEDSYGICEVCGKPGELFGVGWLKTVCDLHKSF